MPEDLLAILSAYLPRPGQPKRTSAVNGRATDDVSRQMLLHVRNFTEPDCELKVVRTVLTSLGQSGLRCDVHIPFQVDGSSSSDVERALHRLATVGVVADYTVEYGSRRYEVTLLDARSRDLAYTFLRYVARSQPSQLARYSDRVVTLPTDSLTEYTLCLVSLNLELMYDTIETARRRALAEMRNLVAVPRSDEDIRKRIEDYFREGALASQFERLLVAAVLDPYQWISILRELSTADEGELRGTSARLLESYPDHAGLLLSRTYAEVLDGRDATELYANWQRTVRSVAAAPGAPTPMVDSFVECLRTMLALRNDRRLPLFWEGLLEVPAPDGRHVQRVREALASAVDSESETAYLLSRLFGARLEQAQAFLSPVLQRTPTR